jgi:predicted transcriptional regulator of viral defense system
MQIFNIVKYAYSIYNVDSSVNIAQIFKLALSEYNITYLSAIAFIVFTLHEIKQRKFFLGHPVGAQKASIHGSSWRVLYSNYDNCIVTMIYDNLKQYSVFFRLCLPCILIVYASN